MLCPHILGATPLAAFHSSQDRVRRPWGHGLTVTAQEFLLTVGGSYCLCLWAAVSQR